MPARHSATAPGPDDNTRTFSNQSGLPNLSIPPSDTQTLLPAQENATTVPPSVTGFERYIAASPVIRAMTPGQTSDHHHLMAWHALVLDLAAAETLLSRGTQ